MKHPRTLVTALLLAPPAALQAGDDPDTPEYRAAFEEAWKATPNKKLKGGLGVNAHGFDEAWVYYGGGADYFTRRTVQGKGPVSWWHNREFRPHDTGYTDDFVTQHALEFIRTNKERPFFCYVPFHIVHAPLQAKDSDLEGVDAEVTDQTKRTYKIYLDNLRLRHADGGTTPVWTGNQDTRAKKIPDTPLFKDVEVRAVPASMVGAK